MKSLKEICSAQGAYLQPNEILSKCSSEGWTGKSFIELKMDGGGIEGQFLWKNGFVSKKKNLWCCIREKVKHENENLISTSNKLSEIRKVRLVCFVAL